MNGNGDDTHTINTITFASHITDYIFKLLREYHLRFLLGKHKNFESKLKDLLSTLENIMPANSPERKVLSHTKYMLSCTAKKKESLKNPDSAAALNELAQQLYGKELLPQPNQITMKYLVAEQENCPSDFPAYASWLYINQKKLYKKRSKKGIHALDSYFIAMAKTFQFILTDSSHPNYQETTELLQELTNFEQRYVQSYIFQSDISVHPTLFALATEMQNQQNQQDQQDQNYLRYLLYFAFEQNMRYNFFKPTRIMYLLNMLANCQPINTTPTS